MNNEKLIEDLIRDEGLRTEVYTDTVGKLSVGVGRNLTDRGVSKSEAMYMLANDIEIVEQELDARLSWWRDTPDDVQRAIANMAFNIGVPRLLNFQRMLNAIHHREFDDAADEALDSKWANQVGARAVRIADLIRSA